jgi:hypothetical protein
MWCGGEVAGSDFYSLGEDELCQTVPELCANYGELVGPLAPSLLSEAKFVMSRGVGKGATR